MFSKMERFICSKDEHFSQYLTGVISLKIPIEICTNENFKKEIINIPIEHDKTQWDLKVRHAATSMLSTYHLEEEQQERMMGFVFSIAIRMIVWIQYYTGVFDLSLEYCTNMLTREVFTNYGIIDEKKAATILMNDPILSAKKKFLLACHYCMEDRMPELLEHLTEEDKREIYSSKCYVQPHPQSLIKFWSDSWFGDIDTFRKMESMDEIRLESAIASGSILAVEYCLEKTSLRAKEDRLVRVAVELMKQKIREIKSGYDKTIGHDRLPFVSYYDLFIIQWVPNPFSADILYFLLEKMTNFQVTEMWRQFFLSVKEEPLRPKDVMVTLGFFLVWPYHYIFISLMKISWQFVHANIFANLLLEICSRFVLSPGHSFYCEDKYYDYRKLLMDLWDTTNESLQKSVFGFKNNVIASTYYTNGLNFEMWVSNLGLELLKNLFNIPNFSFLEMNIIKSLLNHLTKNEKQILINSPDGINICELLLYDERYGEFAGFVSICIKDPKDIRNFIKLFKVTTKTNCLKFIKDLKWEEAEHMVKWWCELSETETTDLKEEIVMSKEGKELCKEFYIRQQSSAESFIRWGIPQDGITSYETKLLEEEEGIKFCERLAEERKFPLLDRLIKQRNENAVEIRRFKYRLAFTIGFSLCRKFILGCDGDGYLQASEFLEWCLPLMRHRIVFIRNFLKHDEGCKWFVFHYLEMNDYENIQRLFLWMYPFTDEIKRFKKNLIYHKTTKEFLADIMLSVREDGTYPPYEGKQESIENFLKLFLVDLEAIQIFKKTYNQYVLDDLVQISLKHIVSNYFK